MGGASSRRKETIRRSESISEDISGTSSSQSSRKRSKGKKKAKIVSKCQSMDHIGSAESQSTSKLDREKKNATSFPKSKQQEYLEKQQQQQAQLEEASVASMESQSSSKMGKKKEKEKEKENEMEKGKAGKNVQIQDGKEGTPAKSIQKSISFSDHNKTNITPPTVYRKKSMCHSLDVRDLNLGELRSRSESDKSLRYSDFNKLVRQRMLYDWQMAPADIPLHGVSPPRFQSVCYICGVYTGSGTRACRVCFEVYHDLCLSKIGVGLDAQARKLTECDAWSCHQCRLLSHLLTGTDVREIQKHFSDLDMDNDNITLDDYCKYYRMIILGVEEEDSNPDAFRQACEAKFKVFDPKNEGTVDFDQFLDLVAVNILQKRTQHSLVHVLTEPELTKARNLYLQLEKNCPGEVTAEACHRAITQFDKNTQEIFRLAESGFDKSSVEPMSTVSWGSFLCTVAIHILVQRPNYSLDFSAITNPSNVNNTAFDKTQSFDSLDEAYKSCCSDFDLSKDEVEQDDKKSVTLLEDVTNALPCSMGNRDENRSDGKLSALLVHNNNNNNNTVENGDETPSQSQSTGSSEQHLWAAPFSPFSRHPAFSQTVSSVSTTSPTEPCDVDTLIGEKQDGAELRDAPRSGKFRKSEDLSRPNKPNPTRRVVSQKMIAPAFGRLVDRVQQEDWC